VVALAAILVEELEFGWCARVRIGCSRCGRRRRGRRRRGRGRKLSAAARILRNRRSAGGTPGDAQQELEPRLHRFASLPIPSTNERLKRCRRARERGPTGRGTRSRETAWDLP